MYTRASNEEIYQRAARIKYNNFDIRYRIISSRIVDERGGGGGRAMLFQTGKLFMRILVFAAKL